MVEWSKGEPNADSEQDMKMRSQMMACIFYRKDAKTQSFRRDLSGPLAPLCLCGEKSLGTPSGKRTSREQMMHED